MSKTDSQQKVHGRERDIPTLIVWALLCMLCVILLLLIAAVLGVIWTHRGFFGFPILGAGKSSYNPTTINQVFPLIEALVLFVGFCGTVLQLRRNRLDRLVEDKWQRAEFVAQEFRTFNTDRAVKNTKNLLESIAAGRSAVVQIESSDVSIPSHENPTPRKTADRGAVHLTEVTLSPQEIMNTLTPESHAHFTDVDKDAPLNDAVPKWTQVDTLLLNDVDQFMNYLINFSKLYRQGILYDEDLHPYLYYWFEIMVGVPNPGLGQSSRADKLRLQLQKFLKCYYNGPSEDRSNEGQCAFICTILEFQGVGKQGAPSLYDRVFAKLDTGPSWKGLKQTDASHPA